MTADPIQIVCANCGAKYKLPADFKAASAKCKGCGATIDVAGQLQAAKSPAPKAPAAAATASKAAPTKPSRAEKPAASSSRRGAAAAAEASGSRSSRRAGSSARRGRGSDGDESDAEGGRRRRGGAPAAKKGNPAVLFGSLALLVILGGGLTFFMLKGGDKPADVNSTAQNSGAQDANAGATGSAATEGAKDAGHAKPGDPAATGGSAQATGSGTAEPTKPKDPPKDPPKDAPKDAPKDPPKEAEPTKPLTAAEVFDPRTLDPLEYPEYVAAALRTEIDSLCGDLRNGGRAGREAKRRLAEIGHPALVGVINAYQKIDFKDPDQSMFAFEMNKLLTDSFGAGVVSTNFKVTLQGDPIPPETADWNAKTVNAWRRFWGMYPEKEKWEAMIARRKEGKGSDEGK